MKPLYTKIGLTVTELKNHIKDWPEIDAMGEPTEVWLETGNGLTSQCRSIELLNYRLMEDGSPTSDLLLCPPEYTYYD